MIVMDSEAGSEIPFKLQLCNAVESHDLEELRFLMAEVLFGERDLKAAIVTFCVEDDPNIANIIWEMFWRAPESFDINEKVHTNGTLAQVAVVHNAPACLELILKVPGHNLDIEAQYMTPLTLAMHYDHFQCTEKLLRANCDVNYKLRYLGSYAIHFAGSVPNIKLLLSQDDIDVNVQSGDGRGLVHYIAENSPLQVLEYLVKHPKIDLRQLTSLEIEGWNIRDEYKDVLKRAILECRHSDAPVMPKNPKACFGPKPQVSRTPSPPRY